MIKVSCCWEKIWILGTGPIIFLVTSDYLDKWQWKIESVQRVHFYFCFSSNKLSKISQQLVWCNKETTHASNFASSISFNSHANYEYDWLPNSNNTKEFIFLYLVGCKSIWNLSSHSPVGLWLGLKCFILQHLHYPTLCDI